MCSKLPHLCPFAEKAFTHTFVITFLWQRTSDKQEIDREEIKNSDFTRSMKIGKLEKFSIQKYSFFFFANACNILYLFDQ